MTPVGACLKVNNLNFAYTGKQTVLSHISFSVEMGEVICVLGPNGGGKSTLIKLLTGHIESAKNTINWPMNVSVAYLPQKSPIDPNFPLHVEDVINQGFKRHLQAEERMAELLELMKLRNYRKSPISKLSGGQLQKLLIARLFALERDVYIMDEPFNAIDQKSANTLMEYMCNMQKEGKTIIMVLHNHDLARRFVPRCLYIDNKLKADAPVLDALRIGEKC